MKRDDTKLLIEMMQILLNGGSFSVKALEKKYGTPERTIRSKIQKQNTEIKNTAQICAVFLLVRGI